MTGHLLSHAARWHGVYRARCQGGWDLFHATLPALWALHDRHLAAVRSTVAGGR